MIVSAVFSLDMLQTGSFDIVKYVKSDRDEINRLLDKSNSITNTMVKGDATKILESFLGRKLPQPMRNYGDLFLEFNEMLFVTFAGINLKTQSFDKYEPWMDLRFYYVKRK